MELGASGNPNFDIERFGVHILASPHHADALIVTGPVSKGMQVPLRRCCGAMAEPKAVIAMGTFAISGGIATVMQMPMVWTMFCQLMFMYRVAHLIRGL